MGLNSLEQVNGCGNCNSGLEHANGCGNAKFQDFQQQELAALEKGMTDLALPLLPSPSPFLSSSVSFSSSEELTVREGSDCGADAREHIDSFLRDALNSRNRITVLRLEHEVEKFMRNSMQQQLQLKPIPSSYDRLAAHRVAQHYHLESMVVGSHSPAGSRILLLKSPKSRFPNIRLADIPLDSTPQEKSATPPLEKVAIKQRTNGSCSGYSHDSNVSGRVTPVKSLEERKDEYNKARARIFCLGDVTGREDDEYCIPSLTNHNHLASLDLQVSTADGNISFDGGKDKVQEYEVRGATRVAIFRDREKDMQDPDYDRSYDRYSHRASSWSEMGASFPVHGMMNASCINPFSYSSMNGPEHLQMCSNCPSFSAPYILRGQWTAPAGVVGACHPNAFYGNFSRRNASYHGSLDGYLSSQRFPCPGQLGHVDQCQYPSLLLSQYKACSGELIHQG